MGAYADWNDYNDMYLLGREASISQTDFAFWERRARTFIDGLTRNRLHDTATLEKHKTMVVLCVCELAEYYSSDAVRDSKGLTSVSVAGHSMAFDAKKSAGEVREIVFRNLGGTGLLYAGVR